MARKKDKDDQPGQSNGDGPSEEAPQALLGTAEGGRAATQAQLTVLAQYIKDLSFENPGAPQSLQGPVRTRSSRWASTCTRRRKPTRLTRSRSISRSMPRAIRG